MRKIGIFLVLLMFISSARAENIDLTVLSDYDLLVLQNRILQEQDSRSEKSNADSYSSILNNPVISHKMEEENSLYHFDELISLCESSITESTDNSDPVFQILTLSQEADNLMDGFCITYDKFGEKYDIKYQGLEDISDTVSIATYGSIEKVDLSFIGQGISWNPDYSSKIGFTNSDWIFFDTIYIVGDNIGSMRYQIRSHTDVLNNGDILEFVDFDFDIEEATAIKNAVNPEIRFMNSETGKTIDRSLSAQEVNAIYSLARVRRIYVEIADIIFDIQNEK